MLDTATASVSSALQRSRTTIADRVVWSGRAALVITTALAPMAWGTTYLVTTELLPAGRPLLAGCLRALPAGVALAAFTRTRPMGEWWWKAVVLGGTQHRWVLRTALHRCITRPRRSRRDARGRSNRCWPAGLAAIVMHEPLRRATTGAGALGDRRCERARDVFYPGKRLRLRRRGRRPLYGSVPSSRTESGACRRAVGTRTASRNPRPAGDRRWSNRTAPRRRLCRRCVCRRPRRHGR